MNTCELAFRFVLTCFLLRYDARAEYQYPRYPRHCDFDEARKDYNATDLLQCIDELAVDLVDRESGNVTNGKGRGNGSTGRQISFMDVFSGIFNDAVTSDQSNPKPTSVYQQSNRPSGTAGLSPGFQLNLLDALSAISRHDDHKCVPRILCEMASGRLPGRSLGKRGSGFFEFLGRNVFTDWLTKIDVAAASPLLYFGRAMILGYSNRGNSRACYEAYPKCPRDMNGLIYYLNNYNGGFFRLFSKFHGGKYREYDKITTQRVGGQSKIEVRERIVAGASNEYIRGEPPRKEIQFPVVNQYQQYFKQREYPMRDGNLKSGNEIIFPGRSESDRKPAMNSLKADALKSESNSWRKDNVAFFPQDRGDRRFSRFRFPSSSIVIQ
ncbi:uncharacterized protein LOC143429275 [Xylocopa sonorina]|uniref:uncharacterized protein LOC143429275 n=1 Tax=Xylocopa sonorina TaxID=1818115 RepID=UPI00403B0961